MYRSTTTISLIPIGTIQRAKGFQGEVIIALTSAVYAKLNCEFAFVYRDGLPIPFKIEYLKGNKDSFICKFFRITSEKDANNIKGATVAITTEEYQNLLQKQQEQDFSLDLLVGYTLHHPKLKTIGTITHVANNTANPLLYITANNKEVILPLVQDWIQNISVQNQSITMLFPEELLTLN